jgi:hypothetical protein
VSILKLLCVALLIGVAACSKREIRPPVPPNINQGPPDYEDLRPGYDLRIVLPLLKSGGTSPTLSNQHAAGATISLSAPDLIGYETIRYAVMGKRGNRVQLKFASAEITKKGASSPISEPPALPFLPPRKAEHIRLIYFVRLSDSDHNMAIISSKHMDDLNKLTMQIRKDPNACINTQDASCSWVPAGVAVRPEEMKRN